MTLQHLNQTNLKKSLSNFFSWLVENGVLIYIIPHPVRMVHNNLSEYFDREEKLSESPWGTNVHYFHRPSADYINETIQAGFTIDAVDEPEPLKEGENDPDYKKYTSFPSRLVVRATKKH